MRFINTALVLVVMGGASFAQDRTGIKFYKGYVRGIGDLVISGVYTYDNIFLGYAADKNEGYSVEIMIRNSGTEINLQNKSGTGIFFTVDASSFPDSLSLGSNGFFRSIDISEYMKSKPSCVHAIDSSAMVDGLQYDETSDSEGYSYKQKLAVYFCPFAVFELTADCGGAHGGARTFCGLSMSSDYSEYDKSSYDADVIGQSDSLKNNISSYLEFPEKFDNYRKCIAFVTENFACVGFIWDTSTTLYSLEVMEWFAIPKKSLRPARKK